MNFTYQGQGGGGGGGEGGSETGSAAREHMFEKVVTPSDVGKLNRLVIPKQHAEKYFPLDPSSSDKGLLLNFEDRSGKPWRFRYSYWNSSQSYVMTKGWSRFVKDKKLDAGDVVSFLRASNDHRLFIDFRRRPDAPSLTPWGPFFLPTTNYYPNNYSSTTIVNGNPCPLLYLRDPSPALHHRNLVFDSVPVVQGKVVAAKRLRLFGVNMDCPIDDSENDNNNNNNINIVSSSSSSSAAAHHTELMMMPSSRYQSSSSSSSSSSSLARLRHSDDFDCKGKGSMSLDLDI